MAGCKWIVGNWKMNGTLESARDLAMQLTEYSPKVQGVKANKLGGELNSQNHFLCPSHTLHLVVCPSFVHLALVRGRLIGSGIALGAQNCAAQEKGALTGEISPSMLKDAGCSYVILGHSERRLHCAEKNQDIYTKVTFAHAVGLIPIICVGETLQEREKDQTLAVIERQVTESLPPTATPQNTLLAYEPVWAIGSGKRPSDLEIMEVHRYIARVVNGLKAPPSPTSEEQEFSESIPVLYGGSVTRDNAKDILSLSYVRGLLVGGASLSSQDFCHIASLT